MHKGGITLVLTAALAGGAATGRGQQKLPPTKPAVQFAGPRQNDAPAVRGGSPSDRPLLLGAPPALSPPQEKNAAPPVPPFGEAVPPGVAAPAVSLSELEQTALAQNPTIARAAAAVRAVEGTALQVGLAPNPQLYYSGNELGNNGNAGQNGAGASQTFVTGGKLRLSRAAYTQRVAELTQRLAAARLRVLSDVRSLYYQTVTLQRRVRVAEQLVQIAEQSVEAARALLEAKEVSRIDLLQAQVELNSARIQLRNSQNRYAGSWRQLMAVAGTPDRPTTRLVDTLNQTPPPLDWDDTLARLIETSPQVAAAAARVEQANWQLRRERATPIPNLNVQASVAHEDTANLAIANAQATMVVPIWNRNQGGIRRAEGELAAARADYRRVELSLQQRLARAFQTYGTARYSVQQYEDEILPAAGESLKLVRIGYRQGELNYLRLLTAQRTFFTTRLAYLDSLSQMHQTLARIDSFLLTGSLATTGQGPTLRTPNNKSLGGY